MASEQTKSVVDLDNVEATLTARKAKETYRSDATLFMIRSVEVTLKEISVAHFREEVVRILGEHDDTPEVFLQNLINELRKPKFEDDEWMVRITISSKFNSKVCLAVEINPDILKYLQRSQFLPQLRVQGLIQPKQVLYNAEIASPQWTAVDSLTFYSIINPRKVEAPSQLPNQFRVKLSPKNLWKTVYKMLGIYPSRSSYRLELKATFTLKWNEKTLFPIKSSNMDFLTRVLAMGNTTDFTIVAANGAKINCHKLIVAGHSSQLADKIYPSDEATDNDDDANLTNLTEPIHLLAVNFSEAAVTQVVNWMYGQEIPSGSCNSIVEIFQVANTLGVTQLEKKLESVFLLKETEWYSSAAPLLKLYSFVKDQEAFAALRDYLLKLITNTSHEIQRCDHFKAMDSADKLRI